MQSETLNAFYMASRLQSTVLHVDNIELGDFLRFYGVLQNALGCLHMIIIDHNFIAYNILHIVLDGSG